MTNAILADIEAEFDSLVGDLETDTKKVIAFFKPVITDIVAAGKADLLQDVVTDAPALATAYVSGGTTAVVASLTADSAQLVSQGKALATTTIEAIASAAAATAQAAASSASGSAA